VEVPELRGVSLTVMSGEFVEKTRVQSIRSEMTARSTCTERSGFYLIGRAIAVSNIAATGGTASCMAKICARRDPVNY